LLVDSEAEFSSISKLSWAGKSSFLINARVVPLRSPDGLRDGVSDAQ
jgi:hypothetical protein